MNFCPRCSAPLQDDYSRGKLHRVCPACRYVHFRDPKVAVVAMVVKEQRVLLIKRAVNPEIGKWSLPAGFVDAGEKPREAAVREIKEETGLTAEITSLMDVRAADAGQADILIIFEAEVVGGSLKAGDDAGEAVYFSADDIPFEELAFISNTEVLEQWRQQLA